MSATHLDVETVQARVQAAPDAAALKAIVAEIGVLPGSQANLYSAQELIEHIDTALQVPALVNRVTRTLGLRDKVMQLLGLPARSPRAESRDPGSTTVCAPRSAATSRG